MDVFTCKKKEGENNGNQVTDVWQNNLKVELRKILQLWQPLQYVFIDTEFPGFLLSTPRDVSEEDCYSAVKFNVDRLKVIQFGLTLSDGTRFSSWQFNLKEFDPKVDSHSEASLEFLKKSGIDLDKNRADGVDVRDLSAFLLGSFMRGGARTNKWVTFHGIYDVAYMVRMICQEPLPSTLSGFLQKVWYLFGAVYDVKCMARECNGAFSEVGLMRLSKMLGIGWAGKSHQAGHDSLLTAMVFLELKKKYVAFGEDGYAGLMYGVERHGLALLKTLMPYRSLLLAREAGRNSMPGYYVAPSSCYYYGYQPFRVVLAPCKRKTMLHIF